MKRIIKAASAVLLIGSLGWYLFANQHDAMQLEDLSPAILAMVICARLAAYLMLVFSTWWATRLLAPNLGVVEYFKVSTNGFALGMVGLPGSCYAVKTVYLKQHHRLRHQDFFVISVVIGLLSLISAGIVASAAALLLHAEGQVLPGWLQVAIAILLVAPLLALVTLDRLLNLAVSTRLADMKSTYQALLREPIRLSGAALAQLARSAFSLLGFGLLFQAVSGTHLLVGGIMDALSTLLRLVYLLPGNIGIYEWGVGALAGWLGASIAAGLVAAALYRLVGVVAITTAALAVRLALRLTRPVST